ncbi:flagellar biosynthesis anti-sigma factor FlgM [Halobacillus kuroshimensis]|uniref:Negative regulator of flagellin synthesis n=1 Tax=Halobacillus kuroshimensis TaxID=302481 RepID=A0ABS3DVE2_9BACI|nr:flagellar biosynthesis anti-sigma factor FlgM [Halobacillus kuroshimensis]MBN8235318.1 flagellar biosynthesis anti-sigma factor FlgM [Halobacillus kuroshimensis]
MKINRPHHTQMNPYQKQLNQQADAKTHQSKDKLEISPQAKQLQENDSVSPMRQKLVEQIKHDVETGNYQVDAQASAKKMINFFSNKE